MAGAHDRNRTDDLFLTKEVLYQLSYVGVVSIIYAVARVSSGDLKRWSGERVSNPQPSAWKADALPIELPPHSTNIKHLILACASYHHFGGEGRIRTFEGVSRQIYSLLPLAARAPLRENDSTRNPSWSWRWDLNPQPADYKSAALPIELRQPTMPV